MDDDPFSNSLAASPSGSLPFVGLATFAGYPLWQPDTNLEAVILGIPYDEGTSYRPGTRLGPRAIRNASMFYNYEGEHDRFYDSDRQKWILVDRKIADGGDVNIEPLSLQRNFSYITNAVDAITATGAIPAVVGGDHSITPSILRSFRHQDVHYVHFDTHIDCDACFHSKYTHGSPVRHVIKESLASSVTLLGIRGLSNSGKDMVWLEKNQARMITARELRRNPPDHDYFPSGDYYLSLDIDFFDPGIAPATGTPEPGGLFFHEFSDILQCIASKGNIIGFDVVEVNPLLEGQAGITSHLGARCVLELLSAALDGSSSTKGTG